MKRPDYLTMSRLAAEDARRVLDQSKIHDVWLSAGCRVNLIGSLAMGLMAKHRDIDLHIYSPQLTTEFSFSVMARIATDPDVHEIKCINGLHTDERCIAWHVIYRDDAGSDWQLDLIHIDEGSRFDGFFERMARRISEVMTPEQRLAILRLKFETPPEMDLHGVEYYEGVIAHGITTLDELWQWAQKRRREPGEHYWIP
ncbi:MAG: phosphoglycerate mutase family protein [Paramuribaculum sp.]|nr:phosphoglycerate mutase family protein [Paramuribaculum sp.]